MKIKHTKTKCNVFRCNERNAWYAGSMNGGGNSVLICENCINDSVAAIAGKSTEKYIRIKPVHQQCGVIGCKNKNSYFISRSREAGSSIVICKSCLDELYNEIHKKPARKSKLKSGAKS